MSLYVFQLLIPLFHILLCVCWDDPTCYIRVFFSHMQSGNMPWHISLNNDAILFLNKYIRQHSIDIIYCISTIAYTDPAVYRITSPIRPFPATCDVCGHRIWHKTQRGIDFGSFPLIDFLPVK